MGQIIKIQDYVSRYEYDIYRYLSRFIRLKRLQWEQLHQAWEDGSLYRTDLPLNNEPEIEMFETKENLWNKVKQLLSRNQNEWKEEDDPVKEEILYDDDHFSIMGFPSATLTAVPKTVEDLKHYFLEEIFKVQLLWASSTISEQSNVDYSYYHDEHLQYFSQRFPDTYLILYNPIFQLKKASVESDIILVTPLELICFKFLEADDQTVFVGSEGHFWERRQTRSRKKVLNPLISLNRTESIVKGIIKQSGIEFPISKVLISRNGFIDFPTVPYGVTVIDSRNYLDWFEKMRSFKAPLKNSQLKIAKAILEQCKTTSHSRIY